MFIKFTTIVLFFFFGYDNRCLKPNDSKDPEHWEHYDPDDFYEATTKELYYFQNLYNA